MIKLRRFAATAALALTAAMSPAGAAQATTPPAPAPTTAATTDAQAAPGPPASCGPTYLCTYVHAGYDTSGGYDLYPVQAAGVCETVDPFRNQLSSAWNYSGRNVRFYKNTTCSGTDYKILYNGTGNAQFYTMWGPTWNDSVDAIRWG